jgi:hypothetical protein
VEIISNQHLKARSKRSVEDTRKKKLKISSKQSPNKWMRRNIITLARDPAELSSEHSIVRTVEAKVSGEA